MSSDGVQGLDWFGELPPNLPCVLYECTSDLRVTRISSNSVELIGILPEGLIGNRTLFEDRLYGVDRPGLIARIDGLSPGAFACETHRVINEQGLPVWVVHSWRKAASSNGSIIHGSLMPIASETFGQYLNAVFVSEFVHKLGNHFQLINLLIGSLKRVGKGSSEFDALEQAVDRTVEFTKSFSNYSNPLSSWCELDLGEIIDGAVKSSLPACTEKNVSLNCTLGDSLSGMVVGGDPFSLDLAFRALIQNALEASQPGDSVDIKGKMHGSGLLRRATAEIAVADTGSGMDEDTLAQARVPFFSSRRDRDGLGLSLAVRIIELHGGALRVSSEASQGTQVTIILPVSSPLDGTIR